MASKDVYLRRKINRVLRKYFRSTPDRVLRTSEYLVTHTVRALMASRCPRETMAKAKGLAMSSRIKGYVREAEAWNKFIDFVDGRRGA